MKKISIIVLLALGSVALFTACKSEKKQDDQNGVTDKTEEVNSDNANAGTDLAGDLFKVEANTAKINWKASKVGGKHNGTIDIKEGFVAIDKGEITGGSFVIDMNSINVLDQEGEWKMKLERHLKGMDAGKEDHFFNAAKFPTATFEITKIADLEGNEKANKMVYGTLTMKGVSKPVGLTAMVSQSGESVNIQTQELVLDRTEWGVNYNSKKIFADLKDNFIHDEIKLDFGFVASKS